MTQNSMPVELYPAPRVEVRPLLRNVYLWMTLGLLLTTATAYLTTNYEPIRNLLSYPLVVFGAFIVQLVLVFALAAAVTRLSSQAATAIFLAYAALNGFTLSLLLMYYDAGTVTTAFLSTAALFGAMTVVGLTTSMDLSKLGPILFMGLIGLLIALVINMFLRSSGFDLVISIIGVVLFTALTAYDTQKIVRMASDPKIQAEGGELLNKLSILGALMLYLDFLNLFIYLLRLLGRSR